MLVRLSGVVLTVIKKIIIIIIIMKAFYIFHRLEIRQTLKETWK